MSTEATKTITRGTNKASADGARKHLSSCCWSSLLGRTARRQVLPVNVAREAPRFVWNAATATRLQGCLRNGHRQPVAGPSSPRLRPRFFCSRSCAWLATFPSSTIPPHCPNGTQVQPASPETQLQPSASLSRFDRESNLECAHVFAQRRSRKVIVSNGVHSE